MIFFLALLFLFLVCSYPIIIENTDLDPFTLKGLCHLHIPNAKLPFSGCLKSMTKIGDTIATTATATNEEDNHHHGRFNGDYKNSAIIQPQNAAIVYLAEFDDPARVFELELSLQCLYENFLVNNNLYPVYIFYESKHEQFINEALFMRLQAAVQNIRLSNISFFSSLSSNNNNYTNNNGGGSGISSSSSGILQLYRAEGFDSFPPYIDPDSVPEKVAGSPLGYRFMCRFWAYGFYQQPVISSLRYYWRLDTDLFIRRPIIATDPFRDRGEIARMNSIPPRVLQSGVPESIENTFIINCGGPIQVSYGR